MQKSHARRARGHMFEKDPNVLPFFTLHPKTKIGTILRILLIAFVLVTLLLTFLMSRGVFFLWFAKLYYLVYLVPFGGMVALVLLGLFKRMKTTFTKIAVPGVLAFLAFSILMSVGSVVSYSYGLQLSPKMGLESRDRSIVFLRECTEPDDAVHTLVTDAKGNTADVTQYTYRVDAHRFTLRVPESVEGETYTVAGEIRVPSDSSYQYEILGEWTDDFTLRVYVSKDTSGLGAGEILLTFAPGETMPASEPAPEGALYKTAYTSPDGKRGAYLYREDSYIAQTTDSPLMVSEEDLKQILHAYPRALYLFARIDTRVEGVIEIQPYGTLAGVQVEWLGDGNDVARITPTQDSVDVSGEITIYFNEKASAEKEEATPGEATPGEAA